MENLENKPTPSMENSEPISKDTSTPYTTPDCAPRKTKRPPQNDIHVHIEHDEPRHCTNMLTPFAIVLTIGLLGVTALQAHQTKLLIDENTKLVAKYESMVADQARNNREIAKSYEDALENASNDLQAVIDRLGDIILYSNTQRPAADVNNEQPGVDVVIETPVEEEKAFLGITVLNDETSMTLLGLRIADVYDSSPADYAGLRSGDIIMTVDDVSITSFDVLSTLIASKKPGDTIMMRYARTENNTVYFNDVEIELDSSLDYDLNSIPTGEED